MPAVVTPITAGKRAVWSLLEVALPGRPRVPLAIVFAGADDADPVIRVRDLACLEELDEPEFDVLNALDEDLESKGRELGGLGLLTWLEDSLSHVLRISERTSIAYAGSAAVTVERLFDEFVDSRIQRYLTHLPRYTLRAAATKFGELMEVEEQDWVRIRPPLRLSAGMFVAQVVGQSMEPRIPDGSYCVFRTPVVGSRNGRLLLIEQVGEDDIASRFTVKRYARVGLLREGEERTEAIRLEPLNPLFAAFDLEADRFSEHFKVLAEFVQVLDL